MEHTYQIYEHTGLWHVIKNAMDSLMESRDIKIISKKERVIGFLCKKIMDESNRLALQSFPKP